MSRARLLVSLLLLSTALPVPGSLRAASAVERCGPGDLVETGPSGAVPLADQLSGRSREGYACNLRMVATTGLGGRGGDTQMTWYGDCAYRSVGALEGEDGDGIAVVDVRRPARPRLVRVLREPEWAGRGGPVLGIHEGIHTSERRGILVVPIGTMLTVYDISKDCRRPRLLSHFEFDYPDEPLKGPEFGGAGVHSGQLSPDGTFYYATDIGNGATSPTGPCLTIVDLKDLRRPKLVMRWGEDFPCHDLDFNEDGTRAYLGFYGAYAGHPAAVVGAFTPAVQLSQAITGLRIVDIGQVLRRMRSPQIRILGEITGGRQHTATFARIGKRSYVLSAEEGYCPGGTGRIVDVTDEANPVEVAEISLDVNEQPGCMASQPDSDAGQNLLQYMSHYVSVDDRRDARLAFFSWYSSGLRVFDIRDPANPVEVAYLNPGVGPDADRTHDSTTTYPRYVPSTGQVWVGSGVNAFWVAELDPRLRPRRPGTSRRWSADAMDGPVRPPTLRAPQGSAPSSFECSFRRP